MQAPSDITLHRQSRVLEVAFAGGVSYRLPLEYLRVYSPSAEVTGHGGPRKLETGKRNVGIDSIESVGQYAIQPHFDDGHNTGVYSWDLLRELGEEYEANWTEYMARLAEAGASRDA